MSEYTGKVTMHTRKGKPRRCEWCGQMIVACERYAKWLYFADGDRTTVYAHAECLDAWQKAASDEGDIVYACGENERPVAAKTEGGNS